MAYVNEGLGAVATVNERPRRRPVLRRRPALPAPQPFRRVQPVLIGSRYPGEDEQLSGLFSFVGKAVSGIAKGVGKVVGGAAKGVGKVVGTVAKVPLAIGKVALRLPKALVKGAVAGGKFVATKAIPAAGKVVFNVAKKASSIAKLIPGPHQPFAMGFDTVFNQQQQPQQPQFPVYQSAGGGGAPLTFPGASGDVEVGTMQQQPSAISPTMLAVLGLGAVVLLTSSRRK